MYFLRASDEKLSSFRRRFIRAANYVCNKARWARFKKYKSLVSRKSPTDLKQCFLHLWRIKGSSRDEIKWAFRFIDDITSYKRFRKCYINSVYACGCFLYFRGLISILFLWKMNIPHKNRTYWVRLLLRLRNAHTHHQFIIFVLSIPIMYSHFIHNTWNIVAAKFKMFQLIDSRKFWY